ncbi:HD domain-containing protein [Treponema sp. OMZ 792]|uniref:HD domain-containing protein n=1 Tax=unclassified Treponema TaxID=2638727 RepID=UPI0020A4F799|nr:MULTISPECIES: HD domain-containing protein [unclassified Treponema]UTC74019.1 HD domain-containing protein [Treponema sp. OMZ 792]UTC80419.1 HD domain-containing protein [Treponema sp. OMZ 798]
MLPSKEEAERLLEEAYLKNPGPWREHSIVAGKCAQKISSACKDLDPVKAYILGLLHDIGRQEGVTALAHVIDGYEYLMKLGYDEAARVCITHSFSIKDIETYIGKNDVGPEAYKKIKKLIDEYEYDDYDRLIQLCDSIALPQGSAKIEERMGDVKKRHGYYPQDKWDKHIELKKYFEQKSGLDIDNLGIGPEYKF